MAPSARPLQTGIALLQRERARPGGDHSSFYFTSATLSSSHPRCRTTFFKADNVPPFNGQYAWFEVEKVRGVPWNYWRAVRQVEPPPGWKPPTPVTVDPTRLLGHR